MSDSLLRLPRLGCGRSVGESVSFPVFGFRTLTAARYDLDADPVLRRQLYPIAEVHELAVGGVILAKDYYTIEWQERGCYPVSREVLLQLHEQIHRHMADKAPRVVKHTPKAQTALENALGSSRTHEVPTWPYLEPVRDQIAAPSPVSAAKRAIVRAVADVSTGIVTIPQE